MSITVQATAVGSAPELSTCGAAYAWHAQWLREFAQGRAALTYLDMAAERRFADYVELLSAQQHVWEAAGLDVARFVHFAVEPVADLEFVTQAQLFATEVFLRRLFELLQTSTPGGRA